MEVKERNQHNIPDSHSLCDVTVKKTGAGALEITSRFRLTTISDDLGLGREPEYAVLSVNKNDINAWERYIAFMKSEPTAPDYMHTNDNRLMLFGLFVESYCQADDEEDARTISIKNYEGDGEPEDVFETQISSRIYAMKAKSCDDCTFDSDIEEMVVGRVGSVFMAGSLGDTRWEVSLPTLETMKAIMDNAKVGDIF